MASLGDVLAALGQVAAAVDRAAAAVNEADAAFGNAHATDDGLLTAHWRIGDGAALHLVANLSNGSVARKQGEMTGARIWGGEAGDLLLPWSVFWYLGAR